MPGPGQGDDDDNDGNNDDDIPNDNDAKADPATNGPKLLELLDQVLARDSPSPPPSLHLLVLKARLALLLLLSESELPVAAPVTAVNEQLSAAVNSCVENHKDVLVRR